MTYPTTIKTNRLYGPFWGLVFGLILIFGFVPQRSLATNNYVDDVVFDYEVATGYIFVSFHVKATFTLSASNTPDFDASVFAVGSFNGPGWIWQAGKTTADNPLTYTAGNTYKSYIYNTFQLSQMGNPSYIYNYASYPLDASDYIDKLGNTGTYGWGSPVNPTWIETDDTYYVESPTLTITFPEDNEELLTNFYITGSFTQPTSTYQWLSAFVRVAGTQELFAVFNQVINATSGSMAIFVGGMSEGYVDIDIMMRSAGNNFYFEEDWTISNIHIVNDLPWVLPGWEDYPPTTAPPVYNPLDPTIYYAENSTYATSTGFYATITGTFAPVLLSIGNSLVDFASKFTPTNASSTGNQLGQSILIVRSYISNINSFFADFPVANFLLLYLIALVVVIVLRLVKGLIGLFKI